MNSTAETAPPSGLGRLQTSAAVLARGLDHRAELAALEFGEARDEAVGVSTLFLLGAVAGLLTGFALNLLVAAIWWDSPYRILAIGIATALQAAIAIFAVMKGTNRVKDWAPLSQTLQQLKKDTQCMRELLSSHRQ